MPPFTVCCARGILNTGDTGGAAFCVSLTVCISLAKKGPACLCRGITCERWVQALALPDQDALYNATFYFPVLDVRPLPARKWLAEGWLRLD